jgi:PhnB protein
MQVIIPMLSYENGVAAIEWLCKTFGFAENTEMRFMEGDILTHAELKLNDNVIMLATPTKDYISINKQKNEYVQMNKWLSSPYIINGLLVYVDDVEAHYKKAKANGAEILSEIEDGFPGKRYRCADMEGHRWMFMQ